MKKLALLAMGLMALGTAANAQTPPTTTTTTTTTETPVGTTTTTTDVTAPPPVTVPAPAPAPAIVVPPARDAITGAPVDTTAPKKDEKESLRDRVREKISEEAGAK